AYLYFLHLGKQRGAAGIGTTPTSIGGTTYYGKNDQYMQSAGGRYVWRDQAGQEMLRIESNNLYANAICLRSSATASYVCQQSWASATASAPPETDTLYSESQRGAVTSVGVPITIQSSLTVQGSAQGANYFLIDGNGNTVGKVVTPNDFGHGHTGDASINADTVGGKHAADFLQPGLLNPAPRCTIRTGDSTDGSVREGCRPQDNEVLMGGGCRMGLTNDLLPPTCMRNPSNVTCVARWKNRRPDFLDQEVVCEYDLVDNRGSTVYTTKNITAHAICCKPAAPPPFPVTATAQNCKQVELRWVNVNDELGYKVYNEWQIKINDLPIDQTTLIVQDANVAAGVQNVYYVSYTYYEGGQVKESARTRVAVNVPACVPLPAPTNVQGTTACEPGGTPTFTLSWDAVSGATSYRIYETSLNPSTYISEKVQGFAGGRISHTFAAYRDQVNYSRSFSNTTNYTFDVSAYDNQIPGGRESTRVRSNPAPLRTLNCYPAPEASIMAIGYTPASMPNAYAQTGLVTVYTTSSTQTSAGATILWCGNNGHICANAGSCEVWAYDTTSGVTAAGVKKWPPGTTTFTLPSGIAGTEYSEQIPVGTTRDYRLTCTNAGTFTGTASVQVQVLRPPPTVTLTANPTTVNTGGNTTLTWTVSNATSCTASGGWSGSKSVSGGSEVKSSLVSNQTYTLACTGPGGTVTKSATVQVQVNPCTLCQAYQCEKSNNRNTGYSLLLRCDASTAYQCTYPTPQKISGQCGYVLRTQTASDVLPKDVYTNVFGGRVSGTHTLQVQQCSSGATEISRRCTISSCARVYYTFGLASASAYCNPTVNDTKCTVYVTNPNCFNTTITRTHDVLWTSTSSSGGNVTCELIKNSTVGLHQDYSPYSTVTLRLECQTP
ncbi:hypothetical protein HY629_02845, partial [Candidatus Uhrbacteria bacterium]|nr:hypothetical protein [Candidatus Uhrbacteria bacterium]